MKQRTINFNGKTISVDTGEEVGLTLRDYQVETINQVRSSFSTGRKQVVMLPTGSGKTALGSFMIKGAASKGIRCGFVCDRIELIDQTSRRFFEDGIDHGIIQASNPLWAPEKPVQVCSIQTLARRSVESFGLLIIDEVHTWFRAHKKLLENNPDCFVVGLSATPFTKSLGKYFDGLVNPVTTRYLIDAGYLSDFDVYGPNTIDISGVKTIAGDFDNEELGRRADQPKLVAAVVETWLKLGRGRKTICFATNIAHSKHLVKEFNRKGINAEHIDHFTGKTADEDTTRKEVIDRFKTGSTTVLCNVDILTKGFDYPEVSCIIQARPTKSLMIHIQQIGRGLRFIEGKRCIILDHAGNHARLGFADSELPTKLDDGKKKENGEGKDKEKPEPLPKPCPSCDFMKPASVRKCPACGFIPVFTEDVETAPGELEKMARDSRKNYSLEEKQAFLAGVNQWCHLKGWKPGRKGCFGTAIKIYISKFGSDPPSRIDWSARGEINEDVRKFLQHQAIRRKKSRDKMAAKG
jgi:superfamily II DNA or RNA helicase